MHREGHGLNSGRARLLEVAEERSKAYAALKGRSSTLLPCIGEFFCNLFSRAAYDPKKCGLFSR